MSVRSLQLVLHSLADAVRPQTDGDLLSRFLKGNEEAFTEIVGRHGRLVWTVCRNLTRSAAEADDAFQATFLVLFRSADKVRDATRLSAWLHGVAYKVCARARRTAQRRAARERAAALSERNGQAVPDSAWDRALAAVHEEVGMLSETLRIPFVLCCLEGKSVTEAAEQLGWKLGTFSARLTRAKNAVLARLDARGLTLGAVAGLGLSMPPATVAAKATALAQAGVIVPKSILQLTQGVIGMNATAFKVLAVAVVLIGGLGINATTAWVANAGAQQPNPPAPSRRNLEAELKQLRDELDKTKAEAAVRADRLRWTERMVEKGYMPRSALDAIEQNKAASVPGVSKWDYDFIAIAPMEEAAFVKFLQAREAQGWEFNGTAPLIIKGQSATVCVLRRPVKGAATAKDATLSSALYPLLGAGSYATPAKPEDAKAIEAEVASLQAKLTAMKSKPAWDRLVLTKNNLPLEPAEAAPLLSKLAERKFGKGRYAIAAAGDRITVEGDAEVIDWVLALAKKLNEK